MLAELLDLARQTVRATGMQDKTLQIVSAELLQARGAYHETVTEQVTHDLCGCEQTTIHNQHGLFIPRKWSTRRIPQPITASSMRSFEIISSRAKGAAGSTSTTSCS